MKDNLTHLIWLKDASCLDRRTWVNALETVADLNAGEDFLCEDYTAGTFDDWRLPNVKELQSLIHFGHFDPVLPSGHPFSGVQSDFYWSSTSGAEPGGGAWAVTLHDGDINKVGKVVTDRVWAVRGGQ